MTRRFKANNPSGDYPLKVFSDAHCISTLYPIVEDSENKLDTGAASP
jgi:hypothetical protein